MVNCQHEPIWDKNHPRRVLGSAGERKVPEVLVVEFEQALHGLPRTVQSEPQGPQIVVGGCHRAFR